MSVEFSLENRADVDAENPSQTADANSQCGSLARSSSPLSTISSYDSSGIFCRICHEGDVSEELLESCRCSGTLGFVHRSCLEKWLSSVNSSFCEICHHHFKIVRKPRPFMQWLRSPGPPGTSRNLIGDVMCFFLLTPLSIVSTYLCSLGAYNYMLKGKWEAAGLVFLCICLIMVYVIWCIITIKYHCKSWRKWVENNQDIRLVCTPTKEKRRCDTGDTVVDDRTTPLGREANNNSGLSSGSDLVAGGESQHHISVFRIDSNQTTITSSTPLFRESTATNGATHTDRTIRSISLFRFGRPHQQTAFNAGNGAVSSADKSAQQPMHHSDGDSPPMQPVVFRSTALASNESSPSILELSQSAPPAYVLSVPDLQQLVNGEDMQQRQKLSQQQQERSHQQQQSYQQQQSHQQQQLQLAEAINLSTFDANDTPGARLGDQQPPPGVGEKAAFHDELIRKLTQRNLDSARGDRTTPQNDAASPLFADVAVASPSAVSSSPAFTSAMAASTGDRRVISAIGSHRSLTDTTADDSPPSAAAIAHYLSRAMTSHRSASDAADTFETAGNDDASSSAIARQLKRAMATHPSTDAFATNSNNYASTGTGGRRLNRATTSHLSLAEIDAPSSSAGAIGRCGSSPVLCANHIEMTVAAAPRDLCDNDDGWGHCASHV